MSISLLTSVGAAINDTGGTSPVALTTSAIDTTGASLLVVCTEWSASTAAQPSAPTPTITDSLSNSWTQISSTGYNTAGEKASCSIFYCASPTVGSSHTFTASGPGNVAMQVSAWSGTAILPYQSSNGLTTSLSADTVAPGSVTPASNGALIITCCAMSSASPSSINESFNTLDSNQADWDFVAIYSENAYLIQTTAAAVDPTWSLSTFGYPTAVIAVFDAPAASSPQLPAKPPILEIALRSPAAFKKKGTVARRLIRPATLGSPVISAVQFDGLVREAITSSGTNSAMAFEALLRETLFSAGSSDSSLLSFGGLVRETLAQYVPIGTQTGISSYTSTFGPIPIFPTLPQGFPVKVSVVMDTTIGTIKSLREMRVAQQQYPLWDIELPFEELLDQTQNQTPYGPFVGYEEYEQLVQTWLMMYGQSGVFAFDCPWDDSRSDQLIGVGDGQSYIFEIYRTWGLGAQATLAPIGLINAVEEVQVNSITVPSSNYYVAKNKLYFIDAKGFTYPPGNGLNITMTFSFYYLCRFVADEQDFEEFAKNRWTVPSLKFRAVLWP